MGRVLNVKKNKTLTIIFILMCFMLVSGCSSKISSLKVEKDLVGHWTSIKGSLNYYISNEKLTMVEKDGSIMEMTYKVLQTNDKENKINIHVNTGYNIGHDKEIGFTKDKKTITETVAMSGDAIKTEFKYVDNKTEP